MDEDHSTAMLHNFEAISGNLRRYYDWSFRTFRPDRRKRILELGCGAGLYYETIMSCDPELYVALDSEKQFLSRMEELSLGNEICHVIQGNILDEQLPDILEEYRFDYVLLFDVLEHIEDHEAVLRNINLIMRKTGDPCLFIKVPALQSIYGVNDRSIGHYRRYNKRSLVDLLSKCSFRIEEIHYHNLPGIIPWFIVGKMLKRKIAGTQGESKLFDLAVPFI